MDHDLCIKVIIIGDASAGKTSIMQVASKHEFNSVYNSTIGVDFGVLHYKMLDKVFKVQVWDTAGQERFLSIVRSYFKNISGCILVYDVNNRTSFLNINKWLDDLHSYSSEEPIKILVGNKIDKGVRNRMVTSTEGIRLANENNMLFIETSAKNNININTIFEKLISKIHDDLMHGHLISGVSNGYGKKNKISKLNISEGNHKKRKLFNCCNIS